MKMARENQTTPEPNDAAIRAFLLGRLDADEQASFEARLMSSDRLDARVRQAEFHLADEFVRERLDRFDRQRFAKNFLLTDERRHTWLVSSALHDRFSPERAKTLVGSGSWTGLFVFPRLAWKLVFAATVVLLLFGSVWLVRKKPDLVKNIIPRLVPRRPPAVSTPREANHPVNTAPSDHQQSESSLPEHESSLPGAVTPSPAVVATVTLSSDIQAGNAEVPAINLAGATAGVVRFQLSFTGDRSQSLRIEIERSDGEVVFAGETPPVTTPAAGTIDFDVPARGLKSGDYQIQLTGAAQRTRYQFRVE
jgi:hypothetical protein